MPARPLLHEHLEAGKAASVGGKLMCTHCLTEYKASHHDDAPRVIGQTTMKAPGEGEALETIAMDDDAPPMSMSATNLRMMGPEASQDMAAQHDDSGFQRPLITGGKVATRCRTCSTAA